MPAKAWMGCVVRRARVGKCAAALMIRKRRRHAAQELGVSVVVRGAASFPQPRLEEIFGFQRVAALSQEHVARWCSRPSAVRSQRCVRVRACPTLAAGSRRRAILFWVGRGRVPAMGRGGRDAGARFIAPLRYRLSRQFRRCGGFRSAPSRGLPWARGSPRIPDETIPVCPRSYAGGAPTARDPLRPRGRACPDLAAGVAGFTIRPLGPRNGPGPRSRVSIRDFSSYRGNSLIRTPPPCKVLQ